MKYFTLLTCLCLLWMPLAAEVIHLKTGDIVSGKIIGEEEEGLIFVETSSKWKIIDRADVVQVGKTSHPSKKVKAAQEPEQEITTPNIYLERKQHPVKIIAGLSFILGGLLAYDKSNKLYQESDQHSSYVNYLANGYGYGYSDLKYNIQPDIYYALANDRIDKAKDLSNQAGYFKGAGVVALISGALLTLDYLITDARMKRNEEIEERQFDLYNTPDELGLKYKYRF